MLHIILHILSMVLFFCRTDSVRPADAALLGCVVGVLHVIIGLLKGVPTCLAAKRDSSHLLQSKNKKGKSRDRWTLVLLVWPLLLCFCHLIKFTHRQWWCDDVINSSHHQKGRNISSVSFFILFSSSIPPCEVSHSLINTVLYIVHITAGQPI